MLQLNVECAHPAVYTAENNEILMPATKNGFCQTALDYINTVL